MSEQSLKRWSMWCVGSHGHLPLANSDGQFVTFDDVHALIDTLHAIESARGCDAGCASAHCVSNGHWASMCGHQRTHWSHTDVHQNGTHVYEPGKCDCNHGRMMAVLESAKGDKP